jgi:glycolate oxidase FAD binding subunit
MGQQLDFEPMDYGPILGAPADASSLGGALATNLSGPRRIKAGAARDHFLGFSAVSGRGETFKSGGRVVKNVTGYDLCKLLAGSFGTLAAMTEVTIKTLPRPETEATVLVLGLDDARANQAMSAAMASSCDVSAAAHLPAGVVMHFDGLHVVQAATAFRLEGFAPSVSHRKAVLAALLKTYGPVEQVDDSHSRELWRSVRDVKPFSAGAPTGEQPLWRVSTAPCARL